jgi:GGDEF domain-containing protein
VFGSLVVKPVSVLRIGGDEFAVLLPATDTAGGEAVLASLAELIELMKMLHAKRFYYLQANR